jgi:hypothetical protein
MGLHDALSAELDLVWEPHSPWQRDEREHQQAVTAVPTEGALTWRADADGVERRCAEVEQLTDGGVLLGPVSGKHVGRTSDAGTSLRASKSASAGVAVIGLSWQDSAMPERVPAKVRLGCKMRESSESRKVLRVTDLSCVC